ncbi:acyl-CoA thioester hydrolase [Corynebacterium hadale]|nr:acyl-CoA thioester hydrolase [Corynebacterium hadale]
MRRFFHGCERCVGRNVVKVLKILGKALVALLVVLVLLAAVIVGLRAYNRHTYPFASVGSSSVVGEGDGGASLSVAPIHGDQIEGFHITPERKAHPGVVVVYGGSEGGADRSRAEWLAGEGYEVLSMYFFGQEGQQQGLAEVPLEQFDEVSTLIDATVDGDGPVTVVGTSKGAEFVELLAAKGFRVDNVVAFVPASYSYSGLVFQQAEELPSFTYKGEAVPFASFRAGSMAAGAKQMWDMVTGYPVSYRATYESAAEAAPEEARIDLAHFGGNVLLFAGEDDQMWQSADAARELEAQGERVEAHVYPDAGHIFFAHAEELPDGWQIMLGGTPEGNRAADEDSRAVLLERLDQWHGRQ